MDFLILLLVLAVFLLPSIFMMRNQRKRQQEVAEMQASIVPGDDVVTVGGLHATVVDVADEALDLEIAPGVVVIMERAGIMRKVEPEPYEAGLADEPPADTPGSYWDTHPENAQNPDSPDNPETPGEPADPDRR